MRQWCQKFRTLLSELSLDNQNLIVAHRQPFLFALRCNHREILLATGEVRFEFRTVPLIVCLHTVQV